MKYRKWEDNYDLAVLLHSETGTINVPIDYEYQTLSADRKKKLEAIGIAW